MKAADLPRLLDLGGGHGLTFVQNRDGDCVGAIEHHPAARDVRWGEDDRYHIGVGERCEGGLTFDVPGTMGDGPRWTVESWEPLTISPSVQCTLCGNHGFIREGRWVQA